jgi:hypothetical protein
MDRLHRIRTTAQSGITLVDTIVGTALMLVVFMGIAAAFQLTVEVVSNSKARAGAIALANERMEYLKSLTYGQIGVIGGIPAGIVPQLESVNLNGVNYTRRTLVYYADDPGDGSGAGDTNAIIADYKAIRVEISWRAKNDTERSLQVVGRMSPPGIETSVPGGNLTINVVDALAAPLPNAQIDITNTSTTPAISIRTYSNEAGSITFIGAPTSSAYQITVSRPGYSTAQTYAVSASNQNPDPRHLTVVNNQTTSYTFAIDRLSSKTIQTFKAIEPRVFTDSFTTSSFVSTTSNTVIVGGSAQLYAPPYPTEGFVLSTDITTPLLNRWSSVSFTHTKPAGTDIRYALYFISGGTFVRIPVSDLPGNDPGFIDSPIDISMLSTSTYPSIRVGATLSTTDTSVTPAVDSWSVAYTYGPELLPNLAVSLRGIKTIGNSPLVYKYNATSTSDSAGVISLPTMEWDTYRAEVYSSTGYEIAEVCAPQPESLAPNTTQLTRIYVSTSTAKSLLVDVRLLDGSYVSDAVITLTASTTNTTALSSLCGQAFFRPLNGGAGYTLVVSKPGFQTSTTTETIIGDTRRSITIEP